MNCLYIHPYLLPLTICVMLLALVTTTCSTSSNLDLLAGIDIPAEIAIPNGNVAVLAFRAKGHQYYKFNGTRWGLHNATARLFGSGSNDLLGRHFFLSQPDMNGGQPSWKTFQQPSLVTAKTFANTSVHDNSITWNLLQATSHSDGGKDAFGLVTYVQRLNTFEGLPPATTTGIRIGHIRASKYSAIYAFYVKSDV